MWITELSLAIDFNTGEDLAVEWFVFIKFYNSLLGILLVKLLSFNCIVSFEFRIDKDSVGVYFSKRKEFLVESVGS